MPHRQDFAQQATAQWQELLPSLEVFHDELAAAVRLSRLSMLQDRIDDQALRQFERRGVVGSDDFRLLAFLRRVGATGLTNAELVEQLGGSKAGMSNRLDRLVRDGAIERTPSPVDRRSHTNALTPEGEQLADEVVKAVVSARHQMFAGLTAKQTAAFASTLAEIIHAIDA